MKRLSPTPVRFGPFEIVARLGVGGMGEVFLARRDGVEIALKLIRPELAADETFRRMFANEARIGKRLRHPNVVGVLDDGILDGVRWLALEYVDGASVDQLLRNGPLTPSAVVALMRQLVAGLVFAHAATDAHGELLGLLHRDVSCANVLVASDGVVKLGDFGIGRVADQTATSTNAVKGKRGYLAPELLRDGARAFSAASDVFACGVVFCRALTGALPFDDASAWAEAGAPIAVDGVLGAIVARALAPERERRFPTAAALADALAQLPPLSPDSDGIAELRARVADVERVRPLLPEFDRLILDEICRGAPAARTAPTAVERPRPRRRRRAIVAAALLGGLATALATSAVMRHRASVAERSPAAPNATLVEPVSAPTLPPRHATPSPTPPPRVRSPAAAETGLLTLDTEPWGTAWLGTRRLGVTPFSRVRIPAGRHQVALDVRDSGQRRLITVEVQPHQETRLSMRLPGVAPAPHR